MSWQLQYSPQAVRCLRKLDGHEARRIRDYLVDRISTLDDPRSVGKALRGSDWGDCWRYRTGDYRIIVDILDQEIVIHVLRIGNRKDVY
ncbi:MAG TPA: type II toxin-antitoxin system mRNA interferase toxin, RelE/StbE family [Chloroflexi bacterium]|jgi:mRNA interferase RelE/StbE|nr:type II toxin-antitoxin system mRNA interferase toxin, RelE/StbE family [Chloroflexota bacterium]